MVMYYSPAQLLKTRITQNFGIITFRQKRFAHDLVVRKTTGKPIIKYGPGGRSSVSGHIATVFGSTGFLGRYLVSKLAKHGTQVVVPYRDEDAKRHLKVSGDLGQVVFLEFDLRNEQNIIEAIRHSDIVYNLIGRDYETKNFTYEKVHIEGAEKIAKLCRELDVSRLVHVSSLNADINSPIRFLRTKALGEKVVKEQFPDVTIVRPGYMYGPEDRFLNRLSGFPYELTVNHGETLFSPVHVIDVAIALEKMMKDETTISSTFELYGPTEFTPDDIERYFMSDKPGKAVGGGDMVKTFSDLGIEPVELESKAIQVVRRYRSNTNFDRPVSKDFGKVKKGVYHVEY